MTKKVETKTTMEQQVDSLLAESSYIHPLNQFGPELAVEEIEVLKVILERETTAKESHGGLKGVLALSDDQTTVLLKLLRRI